MSEVEQERVARHERRLEHPKVPLVAQQRAHGSRVVNLVKVEVGNDKVLDRSEYGSGADQRAADVQRCQRRLELVWEQACSLAGAVEGCGEKDEAEEDEELEAEGGFEEGFTGILPVFWERAVGY